VQGAQFRRDVKLARRRGKDMAKLREVIRLLIEGRPLSSHYNDHPLAGEWTLTISVGVFHSFHLVPYAY
jgi:addiction module RelE/StbE family toxin